MVDKVKSGYVKKMKIVFLIVELLSSISHMKDATLDIFLRKRGMFLCRFLSILDRCIKKEVQHMNYMLGLKIDQQIAKIT